MTAASRSRTLSELLTAAPVPLRPDLSGQRLTAFLSGIGEPELRAVLDDPAHRALLLGIADQSPFLWQLIEADPTRAARLLTEPPGRARERILADLASPDLAAVTEAPVLMHRLRKARQEVALLVALADLGGVWEVEEVTATLTGFADRAVACAIDFLLRGAVASGKMLPPASGQAIGEGSGLVVLALGKQGAGELNYSSDIDLVVFFDPRCSRLPEGTAASPFYVRLTQTFAKLLQERTPDGYVQRVDLRLRPDPASTAVAIGIPSAFSYYESYGQNWERAAFIKARPVAGDLALGAAFLADLAPFIWRKYFDYAAIADIHAMKRQIHAVRGHADIAVAGHNVKLGRGGIREIEFFVQTQQLIFGGRRPALRGRATLAMLVALQADGWIGDEAVESLSAAYRFLRMVEHRLQMIDDAQTQRLPVGDDELEAFARFAGFADRAAFADYLLSHMDAVQTHYARLFEHAPSLDTGRGSLVFTGTTDDPDTLATLSQMGFARPEVAAEIIRGWHFGRRAAVQSPRAREVLTELVPGLLEAFSGSGDPDAALATTDTMFARLPAAIELFSLLRSNRALRDLFADVVGSAPRLAGTIAARPHVLDAAIDPALLAGAGDPRDGAARIAATLAAASTTEAFLDRLREIGQEETFLIGLRLLAGTDEPRRTGVALTSLADILVEAALDRCLVDFARDHGTVSGGACVVLGMGKLGSGEMTATSDLDLIVIYRFDPEAGESSGPRPLDGTRYYNRVTQRLIAALTAPTRRGRLYEVDTRLRPSGGQGPVAVQFRGFVQYQAREAQTWEHMALTRARVIAGDPALAADVEASIHSTLVARRDPAALQAAIRTMRALVAKEKADRGFWDVKLVAGGLLDIEFAAQFLALRFAAERPDVLRRSPAAIIAEAGRDGLIAKSEADGLVEAYRVQTAVAQLTRFTLEGDFEPDKAGAGVTRRLVAVTNQPDLSALMSLLTEMRVEVRAILRRWLAWDGVA